MKEKQYIGTCRSLVQGLTESRKDGKTKKSRKGQGDRQTTHLHLSSHLEILWWKNNCSFFKPCDLWSWISFNLAFKLHSCTIRSAFGLQLLHEARGRCMLTWSQLCRNYKAKNTAHLHSYSAKNLGKKFWAFNSKLDDWLL